MTDDEILRRAKQGMLNGLTNVQKKHRLSAIEMALLLFEIGQELLKKPSNEMPRT